MKELTYFQIEAVSGGFFSTTAGNVGAAIGASAATIVGGYGAFILSSLALGFERVDWPALGIAGLVLTGSMVAGIGIGGIVGTGVGALFSNVNNSFGE